MQENQATEQKQKNFTVEEANAMLPLVRSIVSDICEIFRRVTGRRSDLHRLLRKGSRSSGAAYEDEMAESRADLQEEYERIWTYREELESLGVFLRQPEEGCIEFPSQMLGKDCYLCWQLGDERVSEWRDASSPHSPKQPLPTHQDVN